MKKQTVDLKERLLRRVTFEAGGCWLWSGSCINGYGTVRIDGKLRRAHRVSWEAYRGPIPDGLFVCHICDVPSCVNPEHLFLGTQQANMQDCVQKDRHSRGSRHGNVRLTTEQVRDIKTLPDPVNLHELGRKYGVRYQNIDAIRRGKIWRHV